ncbi:Serine-type carboxypeptidase F [Talaromyces atroroseus]|uniref:Carboxypeptidase n=1 Tax=Talaromyces atroroseus TaxID=1441469 RepID=A0A1Q5QBF7_TALAT|nr:Serine-type carboxypeptidase F [Talaromyces atroroseus]OKL63264.1 Serine-type carboxypeptidase F [Talaromyces atroroseus]
MLVQSVLSAALLAAGLLVDGTLARGRVPISAKAQRRYDEHYGKMLGKREQNSSASTADFRFLNSQTRPYRVESLPDVNFDIGEIYSGLVPIDSNDRLRQLFFVFQPTIGEPVDEVTIWLNGGPGCSSLEGFLQENGRFVWQPGTYLPVENPYSWVNLTNVLWVDQPVGTGFSTGIPTATNEEDVARDFIKFFKNFEDLFGIKNFKIYITGESYAGRYVPYISSAMIDQNNTEYYDLSGALVYDPVIGSYDVVQEEVPVYPLIAQNNAMLDLDAEQLAALEEMHVACGYDKYIEQYLTFPASGLQPDIQYNESCDVFDAAMDYVLAKNPCWNIYNIDSVCPLQWDVLGFPGSLEYTPPGSTIYFQREDVVKALHAPTGVTWTECSDESVFVGSGDTSPDPIQGALPKVIEHTNRVLVGNGDYDFIIQTNGTLLSIQNMTWNGQLGFSERPSKPINITIPDLMYAEIFDENYMGGLDGPQGVMGVQHFERGLMFVETYQSGHMQPQYQPRSSYRHLQWLLGRTNEI